LNSLKTGNNEKVVQPWANAFQFLMKCHSFSHQVFPWEGLGAAAPGDSKYLTVFSNPW